MGSLKQDGLEEKLKDAFHSCCGFEHDVRQASAMSPYPPHGICATFQWSASGEDAAFIAAASPDVVLALIERVRAAEAEIARLRPVHEAACRWRGEGDAVRRAILVTEIAMAVDEAATVSPSAQE